jgi:peptidoglycan/xylan/chitin deacetylase (PgdA/CDA1 family)
MSAPVPILMYHEVTPQPVPRYRKYSVTPAELARQLAWLRDHGYTAIDLDAVYDARRGTHALPPRPVAITFDDGSRDTIEHAVPIVADHGMTATFYAVAGLVGAWARWLLAENKLALPLADWGALREAERAGMRCEAHSVTHPRLATLPDDAARAELVRGRALLEQGLGHPVRHLAYPYGSFAPRTRELAAEAGYLTACTVREGLAAPDDDLLALPRVPVLGTEGFADFAHRVRTGRRASPLRARWLALAPRTGAGRRDGPAR